MSNKTIARDMWDEQAEAARKKILALIDLADSNFPASSVLTISVDGSSSGRVSVNGDSLRRLLGESHD